MNYEAIVERLMETKSDEFNEWESDFMNSMWHRGKYGNLSQPEKDKILEINNKYGKG